MCSKIKCFLCKGKMYTEISSSYDEPPESLVVCEDCGYSEYYSYYDGYGSFMDGIKLSKDGLNLEESTFLMQDKNWISSEEYKLYISSELAKTGIIFEEWIEKRKEERASAIQAIKENWNKRKEFLDSEKKRKENGIFTEEEKEKINSFIENQTHTLKALEEKGVIYDISIVSDNDGNKLDYDFKIDNKKASEYGVAKSIAQKKYCSEKQLPLFAPSNCYSCGFSIYEPYKGKERVVGKEFYRLYDSISLEKASTSLITGCPKCNRSFVD